MKLLVNNGAELDAVNTYGNTALILAVSTGNHLRRFENVVRTRPLRRYAFVGLGFNRAAEFLIRKGANVSIVGQEGN